jgi:ELWxxDGT repeat protein
LGSAIKYIAESLEPRLLLAAALLKDLTTQEHGSLPSGFAELGNEVVFSTSSNLGGKELWKTDGTAGGTTLIKSGFISIELLTSSNGLVYFVTSTTETGKELWRTDGTPSGTVMVKDLFPGSNSSDPKELLDVGGTLFFAATIDSFPTSRQLWKTDGTEAGTSIVGYYAPSRNPIRLTNLNGTVFFNGKGPAIGELWKSDGTDAGTVVVKDDPDLKNPLMLAPFNGKLLFRASGSIWLSDGTTTGTLRGPAMPGPEGGEWTRFVEVDGTAFYTSAPSLNPELWKTNGTVAGTSRVKDIVPGSSGSNPTNLVGYGNLLLFSVTVNGQSQFWGSDGTDAGTVQIKLGAFQFARPTPLNGLVYFKSGEGLWKTDGTAQGTVLVKDGFDGFSGTVSLKTGSLQRLFFAADDSVHGSEPWVSDGTTAGTRIVKNINTDTLDSNIVSVADLNGYTYFTKGGSLLWRTDGTTSGTVVVKDFGPYSLDPNKIIFKGNLYLTGSALDGGFPVYRLWKTDGTDAGTIELGNIHVAAFAPVGERMVLAAYSMSSGLEGIWTTDGTPQGTFLLKAGAYAEFDPLIASGTHAYFRGVTGPRFPLWVTDGTAAGTYDLLPSIDTSQYGQYTFGHLADIDGVLYFTVNYDEIWRTEGTTATSYRVTSRLRDVNDFTKFGDKVVFAATRGSNIGLWKTDGTDAGTVPIMEAGNPYPMRVIGESLYFGIAHKPSDGLRNLWRTDGTLVGTVLVASDLDFDGINEITETVFLRVTDALHGQELWRLDPASGEAVLVQDFYPGPINGQPAGLGWSNGSYYFTALAPDVGRELFRVSPPQASSGGPYTVGVHSSMQLDASASTDPDPSETLSFAWDLDNDGIYGETGAVAGNGDEISATPTFLASNRPAGSYAIKLRVTNSFGLSSETTTSIRIAKIGDLNLDNQVSIADFIQLASHFNQSPATWEDGDLNDDGAVTIADFIDLASNFGQSSGEANPEAPISVTATPVSKKSKHHRSKTRHHVKSHHKQPQLLLLSRRLAEKR